jgi:outer membrane protein assembly factor BamB
MKLYEANRSGLLALILAISACVVIGSATGADWANWRGPNYNGISEETGFLTSWPQGGPKVLWEASVGIGFSSVVVSNGKAFVTGNTGKKGDPKDKEQLDIVYCFDAETGKELWKHSYPNQLDPKYYEGGTLASPTVAGEKVYTVSKDGKAFCLDAESSNVVWQKNLLEDFGTKRTTWGISGSPVVLENMVIYNAGSWGLALNKDTGDLIWKNGGGPGGYATAVPYTAGGQKCLAFFGEKGIRSVVAATGKEVWTHKWETKYDVNAADPVIAGDKIFITSGYNRGCALLKVAGSDVTRVWENKNMRSQMNGPVLVDGYLYGADDAQLSCLDFASGEVKWTEKSVGKASVMAAGGKLIITSDKSKLIIAEASPDGFKPLCQAQVLTGKCWTVPVLANGRIYVRNVAGDVVCVDVKAKESVDSGTEKSWAQWRGPRRDGKSCETGLLKKWPAGGPEMLWSATGMGKGYSTVSIVDETIYTTGTIDKTEHLIAMDMQGNIKWKQPYGPASPKSPPDARTTPTVDGGSVYVISGAGKVVCLDAKTGKEKWGVDAFKKFKGKYGSWAIAESPLIVDDKVICTPGGKDACMVALNKETGETVWTTKGLSEKSSYCSPIVVETGGRKIIVSMPENFLVGVDAGSGKVLWKDEYGDYQKKPKNIKPITPIYHDGGIYATAGYDTGGVKLELSTDGASVTRKWTDTALDCHHGGVVLVDGYIYGANWKGNPKGNWLCLDWKTGKVMYET